MSGTYEFKRVAKHPERWEKRQGELIALFQMSVGKNGPFLVPYTVPELKRIAGSLEPHLNKEGIYPRDAAKALEMISEGPSIAAQ